MAISMTLADSDVEEWWILPLFGTAVLILALVAALLLRPRGVPSSRAALDDLPQEATSPASRRNHFGNGAYRRWGWEPSSNLLATESSRSSNCCHRQVES